MDTGPGTEGWHGGRGQEDEQSTLGTGEQEQQGPPRGWGGGAFSKAHLSTHYGGGGGEEQGHGLCRGVREGVLGGEEPPYPDTPGFCE